jgi:3-oxoacyl-[acyl-carrier protein] reductase
MDLHLQNRIALVTGSSRGLGAAVARLLSMEGAKVVINSRDQANLQATADAISTSSHNPVLAIPGDITDPAFPQDLIDILVKQLGGLDILITNAGGPPPGKFTSFDDAAWQSAFESSLMSHVRLIRAALPYLEKSTAPSVLTITSYSVKQPIPNLILSNSLRAATIGLTKSLALELGDKGIRFNSILPGWTTTERVEQLMSARASQNQTTIASEIDKQAAESALKRLATPEEFANAAVFLVSPAASYITGTMLPIDGGTIKGLL